jgi:murein DD-endopeptidase MepM/ murein hydrolase activator NlpD
MGPRGLLVIIKHAQELKSFYMHLSAYVVRTGQKVKQGDLLGYVGRTGMRESEAHLHFGLQHKEKHLDPIVHLKPYLLPPDATYVGRNYLTYQRKQRKIRKMRQRLHLRAKRGAARKRKLEGYLPPRPWVGGSSKPAAPSSKRKPSKPKIFNPSKRPF